MPDILNAIWNGLVLFILFVVIDFFHRFLHWFDGDKYV